MNEDILTLSLSIGSKDRKTVAVRVCSKEPMPFALATAAADPFHIADLLIGGYGYSPEQSAIRARRGLSVIKGSIKASHRNMGDR